MAERNPAWKRIWDDDYVYSGPEDNIRCRDCAFRTPDLVCSDGSVMKNHTHGYCKVYTPEISNGKPHEVLWEHADCKYYRKDEPDD